MKNHTAELRVIVGLGLTGLSCVRYFKKCGIPVAVTDSRLETPQLAMLKQEFPDVPAAMGGFSEELMSQAKELIVSPGVWLKEPAIAKQIAKGIPAIGDIELFAREVEKPIIAITGSNGKTTVTTLMGLMVEQAGYQAEVCGNIGLPVLDLLDKPAPDFYVMELSSFQLETTATLKPETAVVLNVSPDHMDRYDHYRDYVAAKQRIYLNCKKPIINWDEPEIFDSLNLRHPIAFTLNKPRREQYGLIKENGHYYLAHQDRKLIAVDELPLKGQHHFQNALACLALGEAVGLPLEAMLTVLKQFKGLKNRCQWISDKKGIHWINDTKGTNVGATIAALNTVGEHLDGKLILIAGGDSKNADLTSLQKPIQKYVSQIILLGRDAFRFAETLNGLVAMTHVKSLEEAVQTASTIAAAGDTVLLSPACASFDMFRNYEHRGEVFVKAVNDLME